MITHIKLFLKRQPAKTWIWIFTVWVIMEAFCIFLRIGLSKEVVPLKFPFSVCIIEFHFRHLPMAFVFGCTAWLAIKRLHRIKTFELWLLGTILILSGNLIQGFDGTFVKPLGLNTQWSDQYFNEALTIKETPTKWLAEFNQNQANLMTHSKTHPPFAVLIFHTLGSIGQSGGNLAIWPIAVFWIVISSLCVPLIYEIMRNTGVGINHSKMIALFLAVMPAFNIYSLLSLDSLIFFLSLLILWGIIDLHNNKPGILNMTSICIGLTLINMLSFAGFFFIALLLVLAISDMMLFNNSKTGAIFGIAAGTFVISLSALKIIGYDHARAFWTASRLENENGFMLLHDPLVYVQSRMENICEIILCLGLVAFVMLITPKYRKLIIFSLKDRLNVLAFLAIGILLAMFLTGAYKTGETARACMFIYPFIFLLMRNMSLQIWREVFIFAALQTALMQLVATYNW